MTAVRTGVIWVDAQGERNLNVITTNSGAATIAANLESLSNAVRSFSWENNEVNFSSIPVVATYPTVRVNAQLIYRDATGSLAKLYIPAPISSIFLTDGVTVDPTAIATLTGNVIGELICGSGNVATAFVGGQLIQTRIAGIASLQVFTP